MKGLNQPHTKMIDDDVSGVGGRTAKIHTVGLRMKKIIQTTLENHTHNVKCVSVSDF
jgi:hypothetical protein